MQTRHHPRSAFRTAFAAASRTAKFLPAILSLLLAVEAQATTRYIAQTAGTFSGGIACNGHTTITPATFNALTPAPGDMNYLCGTITVAANTEGLIVNASGTSGNPITIYFDSGAVLQSPYWPAAGNGAAIDTAGNDYITINGNGGKGGYTQGLIQSTLNGYSGLTCPGGACQYQNDSVAIQNNGGSNFVMEGLSIANLAVSQAGESPNGNNPLAGECLYDNGTVTNWTITDNTMHDMAWCLDIQYGGGSNGLTISNNEIYNIDHGLALGGPGTGDSIENINIYGNSIHDYSNWDTGAADFWHHDGIHLWGYNDDGSDPITGVNIYDNQFGGCIGQNVTAHIFMEANGGNTTKVAIYNNTLIDTCDGLDNDGLLTTGVDGDYKVYNNTFIGTSGDVCSGTSSSPNVTFVNNVLSGCGTLQYITSGGGFASGGLHDNIYANCAGSNCFAYQGNYSGSFSTWQSETGQDASPSDYVSSANLSAAGVPQSGSAVIGAGANLTSLAISTLDTDIVGSPRPASGAWDVGAYQYCASGNCGTATSTTTGTTGEATTTSASSSGAATSTGGSGTTSAAATSSGSSGTTSAAATSSGRSGTSSAAATSSGSSGTTSAAATSSGRSGTSSAAATSGGRSGTTSAAATSGGRSGTTAAAASSGSSGTTSAAETSSGSSGTTSAAETSSGSSGTTSAAATSGGRSGTTAAAASSGSSGTTSVAATSSGASGTTTASASAGSTGATSTGATTGDQASGITVSGGCGCTSGAGVGEIYGFFGLAWLLRRRRSQGG